jgi:hypothetical protein
VPHQHLDFGAPGGHELGDIPLSACLRCIRKDGMESIALSERFPIVFKAAQSGHKKTGSGHI